MYDSRSDHLTYGELLGSDCREGCEHHLVTGHGFTGKKRKYIKRLAHKRNRRRAIPFTQMRGYGYGDENIHYLIWAY